MREIRTSGSMSGDGKRDDARVATAPTLDSTENKGLLSKDRERTRNVPDNHELGRQWRECFSKRSSLAVGILRMDLLD